MAPRVAWGRMFLPLLARHGLSVAGMLLFSPTASESIIYDDGWIGAFYEKTLTLSPAKNTLVIRGSHDSPAKTDVGPLTVTVLWNGKKMAKQKISQSGPFEICTTLTGEQSTESGTLSIKSMPCFVPDLMFGNGDKRQLGFILKGIDIQKTE